jgi:hypothetical protein
MRLWLLAVLAACKPTPTAAPAAPVAAAPATSGPLAMVHGARELPAAPPPPHGRAENQACVAGRGSDVAEDVRANLAKRWTAVQIVPTVSGRWMVIGHDQNQSVSAVVDEARRGPCSDGEVFVRLGVSAIPDEPGPKNPGPSGLRAAAGGRMPVVVTPAEP